MNRNISDNEVLITAALWLKKVRKCNLFFCVPGRNKGLFRNNGDELCKELTKAGVPKKNIHIKTEGPDIRAESEKECWIVGCKGAAGGKDSTQRANFEQALTSIVSHHKKGPNIKTTINYALALPVTQIYTDQLIKRVGKPLREQLNLWVLLLLFDPRIKKIELVRPDEEYPSSPEH